MFALSSIFFYYIFYDSMHIIKGDPSYVIVYFYKYKKTPHNAGEYTDILQAA